MLLILLHTTLYCTCTVPLLSINQLGLTARRVCLTDVSLTPCVTVKFPELKIIEPSSCHRWLRVDSRQCVFRLVTCSSLCAFLTHLTLTPPSPPPPPSQSLNAEGGAHTPLHLLLVLLLCLALFEGALDLGPPLSAPSSSPHQFIEASS